MSAGTGKTGMTTTLQRGGRKAPGRLSGVLGGRQSESRMVAVADIQPSPDNPVARHEVDDSFLASLRSVGVIQDLLLVPVETWRAAHPDAVLTDAPYVVVAGHRRLAGAIRAELSEVPARIRSDLDPTVTDSLILHENLHRMALTPSEEGAAYRRMIDRHGISQRQLARETGVSQSQISKKLSLLTLPESIQAVVDTGGMPLEEALLVSQEAPEVLALVATMMETYEDQPASLGRTHASMDDLVWRARKDLAEAQAIVAAQEEAAARGAEYLPWTDRRDRLGESYWKRRITTKKDIAAAQKAGTLVVVPAGGSVEFYNGGALPKAKRGSDPEAIAERERRIAMKARRDHLAVMTATPPKTPQAQAAALAHVLTGTGYGSDICRVILPLLKGAGIIPDDIEHWTLARALTALTPKQQWHAAWIIALGAQETRAAFTHHRWDLQDVEYLNLLTSHGYEPTAWEVEKAAAVPTPTDTAS